MLPENRTVPIPMSWPARSREVEEEASDHNGDSFDLFIDDDDASSLAMEQTLSSAAA
jgi:hypothetical protein